MKISAQGMQLLYTNCFDGMGSEVKGAFCQLFASDTEDILTVMQRIYQLVHGDTGLKQLMKASKAIPEGQQFWLTFKRTLQVISSNRVKILGINFVKSLRQTILKAIHASGKILDTLKAEDVREFFDPHSSTAAATQPVPPHPPAPEALRIVPQGLLVRRAPQPIPTLVQEAEPQPIPVVPLPPLPPLAEEIHLLANVRRRVGTWNPDAFIKLLNDFLYFQNDQCRYLVGRALALRASHQNWWTAQGRTPPFEAAHIPYIVYLAASRRLSNHQCYCNGSTCASCCRTLCTIFDSTEHQLLNQINEVLHSHYGTSDDAAIELIRENARRKKAAMAREKA